MAYGVACTGALYASHRPGPTRLARPRQILRQPALITHELDRAQTGEWLPQALKARRQTLKSALAQLERQQERLLEVYLAEIVGRAEFERKRQEFSQSQQGWRNNSANWRPRPKSNLPWPSLSTHRSVLPAPPTHLDELDFAQRRQLVELLIDRVIVDEGKVEIRYAIPTSPKGEATLLSFAFRPFRFSCGRRKWCEPVRAPSWT